MHHAVPVRVSKLQHKQQLETARLLMTHKHG